MVWASITVIAIIAGFLFLSIAAQRLSGNMAWLGIALLVIGFSPVVFPWLSRLPSFQGLVSTTHASSSKKLDTIYAEAKRMVQQARKAPTKMPTIVSVERITEPGVYDDVLLVYGYPDNYAAAREIAEYATRKYKREYRFTPVEPLEAFTSRSDYSAPRPVKKSRYPMPGERDTTGWVPHPTSPALECWADDPTYCRLSR